MHELSGRDGSYKQRQKGVSVPWKCSSGPNTAEFTFEPGAESVSMAQRLCQVLHFFQLACRYEETPEGGLKPQPPEGFVFTGEKSNTIGPGQYNPAPTAVRPDPKSADFGRSGEINRTAFLLGPSVAPGKHTLFWECCCHTWHPIQQQAGQYQQDPCTQPPSPPSLPTLPLYLLPTWAWCLPWELMLHPVVCS